MVSSSSSPLGHSNRELHNCSKVTQIDSPCLFVVGQKNCRSPPNVGAHSKTEQNLIEGHINHVESLGGGQFG